MTGLLVLIVLVGCLCAEVQPLETRSAGQSITTLVNLMFSFVIGQTYLTMLCAFRWGELASVHCLCLCLVPSDGTSISCQLLHCELLRRLDTLLELRSTCSLSSTSAALLLQSYHDLAACKLRH